MKLLTCLVSLGLFFTSSVHADKRNRAKTPQDMIWSVVKIEHLWANVFQPTPNGAHGTGFYVGLDRTTKRGLIFTNTHVIEQMPMYAEKLTLLFNIEGQQPEEISARLIYNSSLHDFAVLDFDPASLKRARLPEPLDLVSKKSPFYNFVDNERTLRGEEVIAIGNPLEGENITTYGQITGLRMDANEGPFIQTQAPINPGNSGGPMISLRTGEVVGINTQTAVGADGTHWAIPMGTLLHEFDIWMDQRDAKVFPTIKELAPVNITMRVFTQAQMRAIDLEGKLLQAIPDYFAHHRGVLTISDSLPGSGFLPGDILLKLDGEVVGGMPYIVKRRIQLAQAGRVTATVLRAGQIQDFEIKLKNMSYAQHRIAVDFIYVSGMILRELPERTARQTLRNSEARVVVGFLIDSPETRFAGGAFPIIGSLIDSVSFEGKEYKIHSLKQFKNILNQHRDSKNMLVRAFNSALQYDPDLDAMMPVLNPATSNPYVSQSLDSFVVPLSEVLTPYQFSIHKFTKNFVFQGDGAHTWNWRDSIDKTRRPSACARLLTDKG